MKFEKQLKLRILFFLVFLPVGLLFVTELTTDKYFSQSEIDFYLKDGIIEICPLGFIQGRTFKNSIIIADEMQNSSVSQMFMLLTRLGENSKMIINGDLNQIKNKNGLEDLINKLNSNYPSELDKYENSISLIQLNNEDIQRHDLIKKIIEMYKQ